MSASSAPSSKNSKSSQSPRSPENNPSSKAASPTPAAAPTALLSPEAATAAGILPASHWTEQPLDEPETDDDTASTIGSVASSTESLTSTIFEYRTHHGRTYNGDVGNAEAWEPNDQRHIEAMDLAHHTYTVCLDGKLFMSPLDKKKVQKAVDIGTGTGIWAIDFADEFPNAEVIGTDVSPIQPSWVPPNVKFELDDCNQAWTWPDNTFDFVHMRFLVGVVEDWYKLFRQAYRTCKPGGYVESFISEFHFHSDDGSVKPNSALDQWGKVFSEGGKKFGRTFNVYQDDLQRKGMEAAGFTDIEFKDIIVPIGVWHPDKKSAEVGLWFKMTLEMDMEGYLNYVFNTLMGWTPEETKLFAAHARREWNDPNIHGYGMARVAWGRKPEASE